MRRPSIVRNGALLLAIAGGAAAAVTPPLPVETAQVATLGDHRGQGWFWVGGNRAPSQVDGRFFLFDGQGRHLGQLTNGFWPNSLLVSARRDEVYVAETYFSRSLRGTRTDVVTAYDARTLTPLREIAIPPKRMEALATNIEVLSDDERFMLVVNYTPAQSVTVVDLEQSRFVTEIDTPGCASVYPAGPRDFYAICGDGGFLHIRLDDGGQVVLKERAAPLFDPVDDFLTTAASRAGKTWYFVSRRNNVYVIEMTPAGIRKAAQWPLVTDDERADDWRISGLQHTALHRATGRLYVLMHRGEEKTYQDPGEEIWIYDINDGQRVARWDLEELTLSIAISQDATPKLYTIDFIVPMPFLAQLWVFLTQGQDGIYKVLQQAVSVYDAGSGEQLAHTDGLPVGYLSSISPW